MIDKIVLKFGSSTSQPPLEIPVTPITIFVGPNNSGKSLVLREIEGHCRNGQENLSHLMIKDVSFFPLQNPDNELESHTLPLMGETLFPEEFFFGKGTHRHRIQKSYIEKILKDPVRNKGEFCSYFVTMHTQRLDGANRTSLVNEQPTYDLQRPAHDTFGVLFQNRAKREAVRSVVYKAFKKHFVIDITSLHQFRIRMSEVAPANELEECGVHEAAVEFHKRALNIRDASDGVKAFVGIITTLVAGDPRIILIDEPEAFLHPPLANLLGQEVSHSVRGTGKNVLASTHSANFLMGCIQSGVPLNVVRLTYSNNIPTARLLSNDKILRLMRHPLLRSTGLLNGLFYEFVVVCEADADRAFYQEINERLLALSPGRGIPNCLFLNAQNKQTIHEIMKPLREMGIPCAAIVDVDVIKEGGTTWSNLLSSAFIPSASIQAMATHRGNIKSAFDASGKNFKRHGGIDVLSGADKQSCRDLFDSLDRYGVFAVRNGELESWLKDLNIQSAHTPEWLIEAFEKMGEDPTNPQYVKPATGDVWDFIGKIKQWFEDAEKRGMPE